MPFKRLYSVNVRPCQAPKIRRPRVDDVRSAREQRHGSGGYRLVRPDLPPPPATMSRYLDPAESSKPYKDPTPLPADIPKVKELGVTSAPLKSAAFFLGAYCKDYNGAYLSV